jgi:hypothetical protein
MTRPIVDVFKEIATWGPADSVAEELRKRGIKGKPDCTTACPMAVYILKETSPDEVSELEVEGFNTYYGPDVFSLEVIENPDNMWLFVENFDGGEYPFLRQEEKEEIPDPPTDPDQYPLW